MSWSNSMSNEMDSSLEASQEQYFDMEELDCAVRSEVQDWLNNHGTEIFRSEMQIWIKQQKLGVEYRLQESKSSAKPSLKKEKPVIDLTASIGEKKRAILTQEQEIPTTSLKDKKKSEKK